MAKKIKYERRKAIPYNIRLVTIFSDVIRDLTILNENKPVDAIASDLQ